MAEGKPGPAEQLSSEKREANYARRKAERKKRRADAESSPRLPGAELAAFASQIQGGGKLSRSEIVTVRLDPKLRYLADLAARKQRRTLSSYIEWAIEQSLAEVKLTEMSTVAGEAATLWDVDECDRFIKLALYDESLLNYREQVLWKHLQEQADPGIRSKNKQEIDWKSLRKIWATLVENIETTTVEPASSESK